MKIFLANKNMPFIEWKYFYQILLLFGNHMNVSKLKLTCAISCGCLLLAKFLNQRDKVALNYAIIYILNTTLASFNWQNNIYGFGENLSTTVEKKTTRAKKTKLLRAKDNEQKGRGKYCFSDFLALSCLSIFLL